MYKQKDSWDYVTELMTLIPGVASLFSDEEIRPGDDDLPDDAPERRAVARGITEHYNN